MMGDCYAICMTTWIEQSLHEIFVGANYIVMPMNRSSRNDIGWRGRILRFNHFISDANCFSFFAGVLNIFASQWRES